MTATACIVFGLSGQTLTVDVREGRPTSITSVQVFASDADDTATAESATTGSASVETDPNTTLSAAAGASQDDPTSVTLTSGTGVAVDRRYRITAATGQWEDVEIASGSGTAWVLKHPLLNDYASGATFVSTRCSIALSSTWVALTEKLSPSFAPGPSWRVRWLLIVGGVSVVYDEYFDLVRYPARHRVTALDVDNLSPGWMDRLPIDHRADQGRDVIDRAWTHVRLDLYKAGVNDSMMRNAALIDELVVSRAALLLLEDQVLAGGTANVADAAGVYGNKLSALVETPRMSVDLTGGGGATTRERSRPWFVR